jgi:uncharacterized protein YqhQ
VIEGVMMRSPRFFAVACRRENGEIVITQESVESILRKWQWLNKPFLRGVLALIDALVLGMKALSFSANIAMEDAKEAEARKPRKLKKGKRAQDPVLAADGGTPVADDDGVRKAKSQRVNDITIGATMVLAVALALVIFVAGPQWIIGMLEDYIPNDMARNMAAGGIKFALFAGYVLAVSRLKEIRRVFQYHGAEHKVINTFEAGEELTPVNFGTHTTIHPRCGTSFLLVVVVISAIVFCFLGWSEHWYIRSAQRLPLLPVVAGIAYEVIRFAGKHRDSPIMRALVAPGLWMQKITTGEPTEDQIEVARRALCAVIEAENKADREAEPKPEEAAAVGS